MLWQGEAAAFKVRGKSLSDFNTSMGHIVALELLLSCNLTHKEDFSDLLLAE